MTFTMLNLPSLDLVVHTADALHPTPAPKHVVLWLPPRFYAAVAATLVEMFDLVNTLCGGEALTYEFVSPSDRASTATGIGFATVAAPTRRMDALVLLAGPGLDVTSLVATLEIDAKDAHDIIVRAEAEHALIAAHCSASFFLAQAGLLDGREATISWWLENEVTRRFPTIRWAVDRILIHSGRLYTCGGAFAGLELGRCLLQELGFGEQEKIVGKLLVLPPVREFQSPYAFELKAALTRPAFVERLEQIAADSLPSLTPAGLAQALGLAPRTLARRFAIELDTSPGQWLQARRIEAARRLLQNSTLTIAEVCFAVGYQDTASFTRLFRRMTGMPPTTFRRS